MYIPTLYFGSGNYIPCNGILAWYNFPQQQSGSDFTYTKCTGNDAASSKTCYNFRHRYDNLITTNSAYVWPDTGNPASPSFQLYVLDDVNPILSVSGSDPNAPYIISSSIGEPVIGVKSWVLGSSSYEGADLQPWPTGSASTPRLFFPFFTQSQAFEAFPSDINQQLDTTIVMTGKLNYNANSNPTTRFLEYQVDNGVGEGPLDDEGYVRFDQWSIFSKTSSLADTTGNYNLTGAPNFTEIISQSITNNTNQLETFIWQVNSQGSNADGAQTILSLRSSCLNNFRDVYYYQKNLTIPPEDENHIKAIIGYNRTGTFGTGSNSPFEYQVAHQHYTRLLTTSEMNKVHIANISNNTNLQGCGTSNFTLSCQEWSFNAGADGGTASFELCGDATSSQEILTSGSSVIKCINSGSAKSITGAGSNITFVQYCNQ